MIGDYSAGENNPPDDRLRELLVGKAIQAVERVDQATGVITLTDGTKLTIVGNEGCGGCGEGWYDLTHITPAAGVITNAYGTVNEDGYNEAFRIFVVAANVQTEVAGFHGSDNGYYGRGWWLRVENAA